MSTETRFDVTLNIAKADTRERTVTGWAAIVTRDDGTPVIDADDHIIPVDVLKRAVQRAFVDSSGKGKVGINHERKAQGSADLVESLVVTKELRKALGLGDSGREGWIATLRVTDPKVIERIQSGELRELSLKGVARGRHV